MASNMSLFHLVGFVLPTKVLKQCLYELALHPDVQEKVRNEIEHIRITNGGYINSDTLNMLTYMDMVISGTQTYCLRYLLFEWLQTRARRKIVSPVCGGTKIIERGPKKKLCHQRKNWDTKKKIKMY